MTQAKSIWFWVDLWFDSESYPCLPSIFFWNIEAEHILEKCLELSENASPTGHFPNRKVQTISLPPPPLFMAIFSWGVLFNHTLTAYHWCQQHGDALVIFENNMLIYYYMLLKDIFTLWPNLKCSFDDYCFLESFSILLCCSFRGYSLLHLIDKKQPSERWLCPADSNVAFMRYAYKYEERLVQAS